jgi:DnaK suppressor protein
MTSLTPEKLNHLKRLLDERENALRADIEREMNIQDTYPEVAPTIPDPGDASFANLAVDLGSAAVQRDLAELRAIQASRSRMEQDTYGECTECGYEIPYERLQAQPTAERCAPCQELYEKTHADPLKGTSM